MGMARGKAWDRDLDWRRAFPRRGVGLLARLRLVGRGRGRGWGLGLGKGKGMGLVRDRDRGRDRQCMRSMGLGGRLLGRFLELEGKGKYRAMGKGVMGASRGCMRLGMESAGVECVPWDRT